MKEDRDANFIAKNKDGVTVNRWLTTGMLAASAAERIRLHHPQGRFARRDDRIRHPGTYLTRSHGSQSGSDVWAWCDDQPLGRHQER
jgi:hypothetical protein